MPKESKWRLFFVFFLFCCVFLRDPLAVCEEAETFRADVWVRPTFTLRYGLGDPLGLAKVGLSPYQLLLDQSLATDIGVESSTLLFDVPALITFDLHYDSKEPTSMQSFTAGLDAGALRGVFGDFSMSGQETFAVYNKKLKGARLDYALGEAELTGIFSLVEGISESRTFVGRTAHDERLFSRTVLGRPWIEQPYPLHIEGLYTYELEAPYIEDFSEVSLVFEPTIEFKHLLGDYGLAYLVDLFVASPGEELSKGNFVVLDDAEAILLLKRDPIALLRERVQDAIQTYNQQEGLSGSEWKDYPFNTGTDYELAFLGQLAETVHLDVDEESYPLLGGTRRRFYDLRQAGIKESSFVVEISLHAGSFRTLDDPGLAEYQVNLHAEEGILEVDFPATFFEGDENALRVAFDYAISGDFFTLGLSLVPGSDRVYLNDKLLERDVDYIIDYEAGILTLLAEVDNEDVIRVDYERFRGGLGGTAEYARTFGGVTLDIPITDTIRLDCSLLQAADLAGSVSELEKTRTMPNRHIVSGVVGEVNLEDFTADFTIGYADNRFPLDDNLRAHRPNEVTDILTVDGDVFVSHLGGVSVRYDSGVWRGYDAADGLSGNRVYDMATDGERVFFGTSSGLTVLSLVGDAPLDRVGNWRRYYAASETGGGGSGLPNGVVRTLLWVGGMLWIGTDEGLASVPVDEIEDPGSWRVYVDGPFADIGSIRALAKVGGVLYLGTERGLYRYDVENEILAAVPDMEVSVYGLLAHGGALYVASESGLWTYSGWLVLGEAVTALAWVGDELWYGGEEGLFRGMEEDPVLTDWNVTALLATEGGTVWAGSRADVEYRLHVWEIAGQTTWRYDNADIQIDGRDPSRFSDIPVDEHTDRGFIGQFNFYRDMGTFSLRGGFESVVPAFTTIGRLDRREVIGWNLAVAAHLLESLQLDASHRFSLVDASRERPQEIMANRVAISWVPGPTVNLSFDQNLTDNDRFHKGFEWSHLSYRLGLSDSLFDERLNLSLNWSDDYSYDVLLDRLTRRSQLGMQGGLQVTSGLSTSLSWGRPMTAVGEDRTGSETWRFSTDWTQSFDIAKAVAGYDLSTNRSLPGGAFATTHAASLGVNFVQLELAPWHVAPRFDLNFERQKEKSLWSGRGVLTADLQTLSATLTYRREVTDWADLRSQRRDQLTLNAEYTGIPDLRPTLSYAINTNTLTYRQERQTTVDHTLTGRLRWRPKDGPQDDLSLTIRKSIREAEGLTATLRNTFSYPMTEVLSARVDLDGRYAVEGDELDFDLELRGGLDMNLIEALAASPEETYLPENLQVSLEMSYFTGLKSDGDLYHSFLFELIFAAIYQ